MKYPKKVKQGRELAGKNDTAFSAPLTPDICAGRRTQPHAGRFTPAHREGHT